MIEQSRTQVIVAGGGPAGFAAALSAARCGASVTLIELAGCLGGIWTTGLLAWMLDTENKPGLLREMLQQLKQLNAARQQRNAWAVDVEPLKWLLEQLAVQAGVRLRYHTRIVDAQRDGDQLKAVITESKSGREVWPADAFIDCTGDGDLAARAGCGFDMGEPGTGRTQPFSMIALVGGVQLEQIRPFAHIAENPWPSDCLKLMELMTAGGREPSYHRPILVPVRDDLFVMMANHQYGVSGLNADDVTRATIDARDELRQLIQAMRRGGAAWENVHLVATAAHIGVREGRRIRGVYQLTADDLIRGARFDDAVCRVSFPVDIHSLDPSKGKSLGNAGVKSQPYDVPLRSLLSADVENLLMAGRCISGDFVAHSSYRVTGNAVAMGEAAGATAARAAMGKVSPRAVQRQR